jgi:hypothetical protein
MNKTAGTAAKQPPPKPPTPPSGGTKAAPAPGKADQVGPGPIAASPAPTKKLSPQDEVIELATELHSIGSKVPTKNVLDSDIHGARIQEIAARLKVLAR